MSKFCVAGRLPRHHEDPFDRRLRNGLTDTDLDGLAALLGRLAGNVAGEQGPAGPWAD